jgi:AraC-like DNA-binding protein
MIYPAAEMLERAAAAIWGRRGTPTFPEPVVTDAAVAAALARFHRRVAAGDGALAEATSLVELLELLTKRHAVEYRADPHGTKDARLAERVQAYLDANFRRNVTLAELAAEVEVSPFHLARIFRATRGIPPHRYLEQRRVREARELIRAGRSLAHATDGAGFTDQSQMTRHFKRHLGVTPGQYRRAVLGRARPTPSPG